MGLYGNLPEAKHADTGSDPNPWLAAGKLHPAFRARVAPPPSVLRKQRAAPAGGQASRQGVVSAGAGAGEEDSGVGVGFSLFGDVVEEYDPARPNDYEDVINERERKKREAQLEAEKQEALQREQERKVGIRGWQGRAGRGRARQGNPPLLDSKEDGGSIGGLGDVVI